MMHRTLFFILVAGFLPVESRATTIDLAILPADWVAWGSATSNLGWRVATGDVNGDEVQDLLVTAPGGIAERAVCIFFGPSTFPDEFDFDLASAPACLSWESSRAGSLGISLHIRDLDGDGIDDIITGSDSAGPDGLRGRAGVVAIFKGRPSWPALTPFSAADWIFWGMEAPDTMVLGRVGDLNGDSAADLALFAHEAYGPANSRTLGGEAYLIFGPASQWPRGEWDLAFRAPDTTIFGADEQDKIADFDLAEVYDLDSDAFDDLIVGILDGDGPGNTRSRSGEVCVLSGRATWPAVIDLRSPGTCDFIVYGARAGEVTAWPTVGDVDGDRLPDLVVGSPQAGHGSLSQTGAAYVLFGSSPLSGTWDLSTRSAGATIYGPGAGAVMGEGVAIADVNGDGYADIVAASSLASRPGAAGVVVVSGCSGFAGVRDLALDPPELSVIGIADGDYLAVDALAAADIDADGKADLIAGAPYSASLNSSRGPSAGYAVVVAGRDFEAQCTVTADAGAALSICLGQSVTLDASATSVLDCSGAPEYRWALGSAVVRDWSSDPLATIVPQANGTYRVDVRCGGCAGGICTGNASVAVQVDPDLVPDDLGNTLRAVRAGANVWLTWGATALARSYVLHRGVAKGVWPPVPLRAGLTMTESREPDLGNPPPLHLYRSAGASCSGREGP